MINEIHFDVHFGKKKRRYFRVNIFEEKRAMLQCYEYMAEELGTRRNLKSEALCVSWRTTRNSTGKLMPKSGALLFHSGCFGSGTVAHEITHAALSIIIGREKPLPLTRRREERLCQLVDELTRGFWNEYWKQQPKHRWLKA